jgi:membrane-bound ClpP family serine protease
MIDIKLPEQRVHKIIDLAKELESIALGLVSENESLTAQLAAANARIAELEAQYFDALSRETDARNRCAEYADEIDMAKARIDFVPVDAIRRLVQSIRDSSVFVQTQDLRDANVWLEAQTVQP